MYMLKIANNNKNFLPCSHDIPKGHRTQFVLVFAVFYQTQEKKQNSHRLLG